MILLGFALGRMTGKAGAQSVDCSINTATRSLSGETKTFGRRTVRKTSSVVTERGLIPAPWACAAFTAKRKVTTKKYDLIIYRPSSVAYGLEVRRLGFDSFAIRLPIQADKACPFLRSSKGAVYSTGSPIVFRTARRLRLFSKSRHVSDAYFKHRLRRIHRERGGPSATNLRPTTSGAGIKAPMKNRVVGLANRYKYDARSVRLGSRVRIRSGWEYRSDGPSVISHKPSHVS
jgi:hypothetical protein